MTAAELEADQQQLIDRLASHDIRYFHGGGFEGQPPAPLAPLLVDLARASSSRMRSSLIALLLRHPDYAPVTEAVAHDLPPGDPVRSVLLLSVLVAAALQNEWSFSLDLYLGEGGRIRADHLAVALDVPSPREDFGRPCLAAVARSLSQESAFPINHQADWENAAHRLLSQLVQEARAGGA